MWRCPTCKSPNHLEVVVETWARLIQPPEEPEDFQTVESEVNGDQEWGANSLMQCTNPMCADSGQTEIAEHFETDIVKEN